MMTLRRVQVTDFRCLHRADVGFDPDFTLISGIHRRRHGRGKLIGGRCN